MKKEKMTIKKAISELINFAYNNDLISEDGCPVNYGAVNHFRYEDSPMGKYVTKKYYKICENFRLEILKLRKYGK